jgi:hypothetical protein
MAGCSGLDRHEIGVSKSLRVIEDGNHLRLQPKDDDFLRFRHRQGRVFRISRPEKIQRPGHFGRIADTMRTGCHRKAGDRHRVRDIVIDGQRNSIISREVGRFLALRAAQEIDRQAVVHVSNSGCLRPAIRPIRRDGHEPMLIQKLKDLRFQSVIHKPSPYFESRTTAWLEAGFTALMQVNTGAFTMAEML